MKQAINTIAVKSCIVCVINSSYLQVPHSTYYCSTCRILSSAPSTCLVLKQDLPCMSGIITVCIFCFFLSVSLLPSITLLYQHSLLCLIVLHISITFLLLYIIQVWYVSTTCIYKVNVCSETECFEQQQTPSFKLSRTNSFIP